MAVILNISPNGNGVRIRCCDKKVTGKISEIADDYKKVKIGSEEKLSLEFTINSFCGKD